VLHLEDRRLLSAFYNFDVIARTGQFGLTGILPGASINDNGVVAFVGQYSDGEGIFKGDGSTPININPTFSHDPSRTFGSGVQINNGDQVVAVDRRSNTGRTTTWDLRTWDADGHTNALGNTWYRYANASTPPIAGYDFDALAGSVSLSNNGNLAYVAFDYQSNQWQLRLQHDALPDPLDVPAVTLTAPQSLRPMAANGAGGLGFVVVRNGSSPTSPVVLYGNVPGGAFFSVPIANAGSPYRFSALGQSPGISDDGQIVVFYGVDASGPGIFASVNTTSLGRQIVRVASASANGPISQLVPDERVGVNATESQGGVTVTYVAYDASGNKGVYATRLTFIPPANDPTNFADATNFVASDTIPVLQAGDSINGVGTVQDVHLYDPINNSGFGQIAIWVQASGGTAIVRASSPGLTEIANTVHYAVNGASVSATFQPVSYDPKGNPSPITLDEAAASWGVDHFNWIQHVTGLPSTWSAYVADAVGWTDPGFADNEAELGEDNNHQLYTFGNPRVPDGTAVNPQPIAALQAPGLLDPLQQGPGGATATALFFDSASQKWIFWDSSLADGQPSYYNDARKPNLPKSDNNVDLADQTTATNLSFFDEPSQQSGTIPAGQYLAFETSLVGVREDGTLLYFPKGIGTTFTWKSNGTKDGQGGAFGVSYSFAPATTLPSVASGGVFDVQADNALPPSDVLVLAPISNQAVTPGTMVTFTATITDPFPDAKVTFSLAAGAPAGASIDRKTGAFSWTPTSAQAGAVYTITVNAEDDSTPALSATQSFVVNVLNRLSITTVTEVSSPSPGPLQVAVDFNEALQPSAAQNVAMYRIAQEGSGSLPIRSAVYSDDGLQHIVLLTVAAGTVVIPGFYHVYIDAANLTATNGDPAAPKVDQLWVDVTSENTLKPIKVQPDGSFAVSGGYSLGDAPAQQVLAGNFTGSGSADLIVHANHYDSFAGKLTYTPLLLLKNNGDGTYAPAVPITSGGYYVLSITSVDWNHDGSPDLVVGGWTGDRQGSYFYVLLNDGHGNFTDAPETPIPVASLAYSAGWADGFAGVVDLNNDGQWEIVHLGAGTGQGAYGGDYTLEVIGKDPILGYGPLMELPLGLDAGSYVLPAQLVFADLNNDGKPDIITRNDGYYVYNPGLTVFLSTPTGFAPAQQVLQPFGPPVAVGAGNFSGTGRTDLVTVFDNYSVGNDTYDGDVIQVLKNDAQGNFAPQTPLSLNRRDVAQAAVADVNKDRIPDIVMILIPGDGTSGGRQYDHVSQLSVWTWLADGHGGFRPSTASPIPLTATDQGAPTSITLTDLDSDGFLDVALGSGTTGEVRIAVNDGTGNMRQPSHNLPYLGQQQLSFAPDEPGVAQQVFADFNNDGQTDFVSTSAAGLEVYLGQRTGGFTHSTGLVDSFPGSPYSWVKVGDLNNDGVPDVVSGANTHFFYGMVVFLGNGDGTFRQAPAFTVQPPGYGISDATLADVNNDGKLDAVVALTEADSSAADAVAYAVCFGDGKGGLSFNANTIVPIQTSFSASSNSNLHVTPTVGDFNGDSKLDLLVPTIIGSGEGLTLYLGKGNGTFTAESVVYSGAAQADVQELAADVNGDGKLDLVAYSAASGPRGSVYLGDGHGGFQLSVVLDFNARGADAGFSIYPADLALGDFNGDGKLDLAVSYYSAYAAAFATAPKTIDLYLGDGTGKFATPQAVDVGDNPLTVVSIPRAPFLDAGAFAVTDDPPTAQNVTAATTAGSSVTIPVLDSATNPDGAPLIIVSLTQPAHGVAHIMPGPPDDPADEVIEYGPFPGFTGNDTFTYTIADPAGVESTGSVSVTVSPKADNQSVTSISAIAGSGTYAGTATLMATLNAGGAPLAGKTVTFSLTRGGSTTSIGSATTDRNGVASLSGVSLAGVNAGTIPGAVGASFAGDSTDAASSSSGDLIINSATATLSFGVLSFTFDGSAHTAIVSSNPVGLLGVAVSYSHNNVAVVAPSNAGNYSVVASLTNPNYTATSITGTLVIDRATPTIRWANPANITSATRLGPAQLDANASVPGVLTYSPAAGTLLKPGANQTLTVTFAPTDTTDYTSATAESHINVTAPSPRVPVVTISRIQVKTVHLANEKTATDIVVTFSGAVDARHANNLRNYRLAAPGMGKSSKTYNKLIPFKSAVYDKTAHRVTLLLNGSLALNPRPQLRITAAGILDAAGRPLDGNRDGRAGGDYVALLTKAGAKPHVVTGAQAFVRRPHQFPVGRRVYGNKPRLPVVGGPL
jgi:hypothetical protein